MGKRELLLIVCFAVVGLVVYQVTAPPLPAGQEGFRVGNVLQSIRRGMQGNRASAEVETTRTEPVDDAIQELRIGLTSAEVTITGEQRDSVEFKVHVSSTGYDEAEAKRLAGETTLKVDRAGSAIAVGINYPRDARQTARVNIAVPARLLIRLGSGMRRLSVSGVGGVEATALRGEVTIKDVAGALTVTHANGPLGIEHAGSLRLNTRGSEATVKGITGPLNAQSQGGELTITDPAGTVDVETRNTDLRMESLAALKSPLHVNATNGSVVVKGLKTEARIDGNNTEVDVQLDAAVPLTIYNSSDDTRVTTAGAGYTLDAVAVNGHLSLDDASVKVTGDEHDQRASGAVKGGGPALTLRTNDGTISVRKKSGA